MADNKLFDQLKFMPCYGRYDLTTYIRGMSDYEIMCYLVQQYNHLLEMVPLSVITYADPIQWDITTQYSQNTVVVDPQTGTAYLSTQPVPGGVQITNTDYWVPIFSLEGFVDFIKYSIASEQQQLGQPSTSEIGKGQAFWVGDYFCIATSDIGIGTVIVPGTNCKQVTVVDLLNEIYNTAYAVYNASATTIELGWVRTEPGSTARCDTHSYNQSTETIKISALR